MSVAIIQDRLSEYQCQTVQAEENAVKEIVQEICLAGLARSGFFKEAAFQGGTCLRILYQMPRFSEDLDFLLKKSQPDFEIKNHLKHVQDELKSYGLEFQLRDRSQSSATVKKAFLKNDSWGKVLELQYFKPSQQTPQKILIKIEIDTNPPAGSQFEDKTLSFPFPFSVGTQDLPSLFAGKSHALLCRPYIKGRDWYDFLWYVRKKVHPNFLFLENALNQIGPWKGKKIKTGAKWYLKEMNQRIEQINWDEARQDVSRFVQENELRSLELWSKDFFQERLQSLI